jgi:broad specificity phosphatase PhoE
VRLVLVRHCQSAVDAAAHPSTWGLTAEGQRQAADLASSRWFEGAPCQSAVDAAAHPSTWGLTAEGQRQSAADLASSRWFEGAAILASGPEPKMVQSLRPTAERLGIDTAIDDAFRETEATWLPHVEFLSSVAQLFASPTSAPAPGWEPSQNAGLRFLAGVRSISLSRPNHDLVVCSGGRALTSLLVELGAIQSDVAFSRWQSIRMPDIAVIDMATESPPVMIHHFADTS